MSSEINIALAQINVVVGAIEDNVNRILEFAARARDDLGADLMICSELVLTAYPPEDLLMRPGFVMRLRESISSLVTPSGRMAACTTSAR